MFRGHNSIKIGSIIPKTKLDLHILKINLYTKYAASGKKMNGNWVDRQTDRPTAAKQCALPSSKGRIIESGT
jgi:hypothetical protein